MACWLRRASQGHECSVQDMVGVPDGLLVEASVSGT